jgi:sterol 3beta-glucosyltransferase
MHITILTIGSRGDVQPYVALALGLQSAGHRVRIATNAMYESLIRDRNLEFSPLAGNPHDWHTNEDHNEYLQAGRDGVRHIRQGVISVILPIADQLLLDSWAACQGTDAIISMPLTFGGSHIAEKLGIPFLGAWTCPGTRTTAFPNHFIAPRFPVGKVGNWLSHAAIEQVFWHLIRPAINRFRQGTLNLSPLEWRDFNRLAQRKVPVLYGYSPTLLPKPPDWAEQIHVTGYWFLDSSAPQPSPRVINFLETGERPIYIGFGSMVWNDPGAMTAMIIKAVQLSGKRAILDSGWSHLTDGVLPDRILKIESNEAPHDWLLPRMSAAIHHGSAGTAGAVFRAGIPSAVLPSYTDQFLWGQRIADLGIGLPMLSKQRLSAESLADVIRRLTGDRGLQDRAAALGQKIRAENGIARAVECIEQRIAVASL